MRSRKMMKRANPMMDMIQGRPSRRTRKYRLYKRPRMSPIGNVIHVINPDLTGGQKAAIGVGIAVLGLGALGYVGYRMFKGVFSTLFAPFSAVGKGVKAAAGAAAGAAKATGKAAAGAAKATGKAAKGAAKATGKAATGAAKATGKAATGAAKATGKAAVSVVTAPVKGVTYAASGAKTVTKAVAKAPVAAAKTTAKAVGKAAKKMKFWGYSFDGVNEDDIYGADVDRCTNCGQNPCRCRMNGKDEDLHESTFDGTIGTLPADDFDGITPEDDFAENADDTSGEFHTEDMSEEPPIDSFDGVEEVVYGGDDDTSGEFHTEDMSEEAPLDSIDGPDATQVAPNKYRISFQK